MWPKRVADRSIHQGAINSEGCASALDRPAGAYSPNKRIRELDIRERNFSRCAEDQLAGLPTSNDLYCDGDPVLTYGGHCDVRSAAASAKVLPRLLRALIPKCTYSSTFELS
jgi:hypothetical protein